MCSNSKNIANPCIMEKTWLSFRFIMQKRIPQPNQKQTRQGVRRYSYFELPFWKNISQAKAWDLFLFNAFGYSVYIWKHHQINFRYNVRAVRPARWQTVAICDVLIIMECVRRTRKSPLRKIIDNSPESWQVAFWTIPRRHQLQVVWFCLYFETVRARRRLFIARRVIDMVGGNLRCSGAVRVLLFIIPSSNATQRTSEHVGDNCVSKCLTG